MKVLYVSHTSLVSGAEGALLDLLAARPESVEPLLACPAGLLADRARALGVSHLDLPPVSGSFRGGALQTATGVAQLLKAAASMRSATSVEQPDLVHANTLRAGLACGMAMLDADLPLVVHCHDVMPDTRQADLVRAALNHASTRIVTVSDYVAARFAKGGRRAPVSVLYNPLDTVRFDPTRITRDAARTSLGFSVHDVLLGLFAQITPWKGQELAIRALAGLRERYPSVRLLIVGEAKFTNRDTRFDNLAFIDHLRRLITELGLEANVEFWGERADVELLMRAVDVSITPSWEEPFGRSVIESMALETPVVVTSVGGAAEFVADGVDGILVSPTDTSAWTSAIASLLESPDRRAELGRRGSVKVRDRFDRDDYANRVRQMYERVLRDGSRANQARSRPSIEAPACPRPPRQRLTVMFVEYSSVMGGGQHSLLELLRALSRDHEVVLACPHGPLAARASSRGVRVLPIPESQLTFRVRSPTTVHELVRTLRARKAVTRQIDWVRPDVVHANSLRAGLLIASAARSGEAVVHCRDLLPPGPASDLVGRFILQTSSRVIAVSRAAAERLSGSSRIHRKIAVIDNPVDTIRFDPTSCDAVEAKRALGIAGSPLLGVIAQITPWKGQDRAVRVLDRVRAELPDAKLVIAGSPKFVAPATRFDNLGYERDLGQLVHELGLADSVIFLGERSDVERILAAVDVLLVPSTEEPFGRTIIEAMAMEVPIVATNGGGPPDIMRWGLDGFFLPPDDLAAWARAVMLLAKRRPRHESRRYALHRFSTERHATAVMDLYDLMLSEKLRS